MTNTVQVYKINDYYIAAKTQEEAYEHYMEESNYLEDIYLTDFDEGDEEVVFSITMRRLTQKEINAKNIACCVDGCAACEEKGEEVYESMADILARKKEFPVLVAKEE